MELLDLVNIMTEKIVLALSHDASVKKLPVFYRYCSGNYHRYFSGKTPLTTLLCRLNAVDAAMLPVKRY